MTWKHVSDALPGWLRAEIEMMKGGATEAAPSYREVITEAASDKREPTTNRPHMRPALRVISSRELAAHTPRARPTLGAVNSLVLVVDNDRVAGTLGEEASVPAVQRDREETVSG